MQISDRSDELDPFETYYSALSTTVTQHHRALQDVAGAGCVLGPVRFGYISARTSQRLLHGVGVPCGEDVDFIAHLGDYIYETVDESSFQGGQVRPIELPNSGTAGEAEPSRLRFLYKTYKSDRNHRGCTRTSRSSTIWDDHEFANDASGTTPRTRRKETRKDPDEPKTSPAGRGQGDTEPRQPATARRTGRGPSTSGGC